jgi:putative oxidoreductase
MRDDAGKLILRIAVGGLLLLHGEHKLMNGIDAIKVLVVQRGLPEALAYGVYLGEVVGPIMIILGLFARVGAGLVILNMLAAIALAGMGSIALLNPTGGYALELEALYLLGAATIALLGAGKLSVGGGRYN